MKADYNNTAALESAKAQAVQLLEQAAIDTLVKAATQSLKVVSAQMQANLMQIGQVFAQDDANARKALFQHLGEQAQMAMLNSFAQKVTAREGPASATHYRAGEGRLAGGLVRRALGDPAFFRATSLGLEWGNKELLDSAAAQWHRLNFGAGGRAGGGSEEFPVIFGGGSSALGFDDAASPGFSMPAGVWVDPSGGGRVGAGSNARGSDQFFPQNRPVFNDAGDKVGSINVRPSGIKGASNKMRPTGGIEGKHFMEAGLRRMAQDLPVYMKQYALDRFKGLSKVQRRRSASAVVAFRSPASLLEIELP